MKRKIYDQLREWKSRDGESALLIRGARRVGKSYIAEAFARNEYRSYLKIDFNDIDPDNLRLILDNLHDRDRLFSYMQVAFNVTLHERESLIIFDEIQECPKVRAAIKYLVADHRYDYIETGSLMSIKKNTTGIVIPSEEETIDMYPMDFEEFLWARDEASLYEFIRDSKDSLQPMPTALHRKAMQHFKEYMVLGGMPQVVSKYLETGDFNAADREKSNILTLYRNDISKHTGSYTFKVESIFDTIPSQLAKHEKRFNLAALSPSARMRGYVEPFTWLQDAMMVNLCFKCTEPSVGLAMNTERTTLKCYMGDTGLLYALAFSSVEEKNEAYRKIILDKLAINQGMFTENIVAQMLTSAGHPLFFYSKSSSDDVAERMELDFLLAKSKVTNRHNITIIEVKSGKNYSISSLLKAMDKYKREINQAIVLHPENIKQADGIIYLPLYMASLL